jgi:hypothetical protein
LIPPPNLGSYEFLSFWIILSRILELCGQPLDAPGYFGLKVRLL